MRYGECLKVFHNMRKYTKLVDSIASEDRDRYPGLIQISDDYTFTLAPRFTAAIVAAETSAQHTRDNNTARARANRPPAPHRARGPPPRN